LCYFLQSLHRTVNTHLCYNVHDKKTKYTLPTARDWRLSDATSSLSNTALGKHTITQLQLVHNKHNILSVSCNEHFKIIILTRKDIMQE